MLIIQNTKVKLITSSFLYTSFNVNSKDFLEVYKLGSNNGDWNKLTIKKAGRSYYRDNKLHSLHGPAFLSRNRGIINKDDFFFKHNWFYDGYQFESYHKMPNRNIFNYIKVKLWNKINKKTSKYFLKDFK
jgi:hypothetical protein